VLEVTGNFTIGDDVRIHIHSNGRLVIRGKYSESASGITMRGIVLAHSHVEIGTDVIIGWDTFITDCDWHTVGTQTCHEDTVIGDHVWIAAGARVLKGARIGRDSIVASQSVVLAGEYPPNSLLVGVPAIVKKSPIEPWARELSTDH
jgi:acetyltransferase-like isoleucine patch superfamily enzyme